jgi:hypothetical protein
MNESFIFILGCFVMLLLVSAVITLGRSTED